MLLKMLIYLLINQDFFYLFMLMKVIVSEKTLDGDIETPVSVFFKLRDLSNNIFLLESVVGNEIIGRYSFIGLYPFQVVKVKKIGVENGKSVGNFEVEGIENLSMETKDPYSDLQKLAEVEIIKGYGDPFSLPFFGGPVGYISYDAIRYIEAIPDKNIDEFDLPEFYFINPSILIVFDNVTKVIKVVSIEPVLSSERDAMNIGLRKIDEISERILKTTFTPKKVETGGGLEWKSNFRKEDFVKIVEKAKKYIENGDIFQVVLSQRFSFNLDIDPFEVYRKLRMINPSPYMFFLEFEDTRIVGSSPEMLVKLQNGLIETRPIAGTRPRGKTPKEDKSLEDELLRDEKEIAEHVMLVDLARNDIGKVSEFGSVKVEEYMTIERYSHVMHIVSSVKGKAKENVFGMDVMKACFPAGTVSGAPKVRAMEIIDELENVRRGPYAGNVIYLGFNKNMDSAIILRTMIAKGDQAYVQAGAGIVFDSVPESEYIETVNKSKAVMRAIELARGM